MAEQKWQVTEAFVEPNNEQHQKIAKTAFDGFIEIAELFAADAWKTKDPKEWKFEGQSKTNGDKVYTKMMHNNKAFVITGEIEGSLDVFDRITWDEIEGTPTWCTAVTEYKRLLTISDYTDVVYGVTASAIGGLVSPRDVITARCKRRTETSFLQGGQSVELDIMPPQKGRVRSVDYPFVMQFDVLPEKPGFCSFSWMSNTDIKGWLPSKIVQQFFSDTMYEYMDQIRVQVKKLKDTN